MENVPVNSVPLWFRVYKCAESFEDGGARYPARFSLSPFLVVECNATQWSQWSHGWLTVKNLRPIRQDAYKRQVKDRARTVPEKAVELEPHGVFSMHVYGHDFTCHVCNSLTRKPIRAPSIETSLAEIIVMQSLPQLQAPEILGFIFHFLLEVDCWTVAEVTAI